MEYRRRLIVRTSTVGASLRTFCTDQMRKLIVDGYDVLAISTPDTELKQVHDAGIDTAGVPMKRRIAPFSDIVSIFRMTRLLKRLKPDIVHSITPKAGLVTMISAKIAGVPVRIHTFTGLVWPTEKGFRRKLLMLVDKILCRCATDIVAEGDGVKRNLTEIIDKPVHILGYGSICGVDTDRFRPAVRREDDNTFRFIFIGRVVADKGISELVEAFEKVRNIHPEAVLTIVGAEEPDIDPIPDSIREYIYNNVYVTYLGQRNDVEKIIPAADCLILPSRREGFPNVLLEACACGVPAISTPVNGAAEILSSPELQAGIVTTGFDSDSIADAMIEMIEKKEQRDRFSLNGLTVAQKKFNRSFVYESLLNFYRDKEKKY